MENQILAMPWLPESKKTCNAILDVAHNAAGIQAFFHSLVRMYPDKNYRIVFGMCVDKAVDLALNLLLEHATAVHFVKAYCSGRGALASDLLQNFKQRPGTKHFEGN